MTIPAIAAIRFEPAVFRTMMAAIADVAMNKRSALFVPKNGMTIALNVRDPMMAPTVFAAYTPPTRRPGSSPCDATAARAKGKLAPHKQAAGRTAHRQRTRSTSKLVHGLSVGVVSTGQ